MKIELIGFVSYHRAICRVFGVCDLALVRFLLKHCFFWRHCRRQLIRNVNLEIKDCLLWTAFALGSCQHYHQEREDLVHLNLCLRDPLHSQFDSIEALHLFNCSMLVVKPCALQVS